MNASAADAAAGRDAVLVTCSLFEREVEALRATRWPAAEVRVENSMLHMRPARLGARLEGASSAALERGRRVVLVYGDCCGAMSSIESRPGVARTRCLNCADLVLGRDEYRRLSREGAFFVFPEWAARWPEIFAAELGLGERDAHALMQDMHRKLVYLDTGIVPVPTDALERCGAYAGLPWQVQRVPLDRLAAAIEDALTRVAAGAP